VSMQTVDVSQLEPEKILDIDIAGEEVRQNRHTYLVEWAKHPPFYVVQGPIVQVVCSRYKDVEAVYMDRERFTTEPPPGTSFDKFAGVQTLPQMDGQHHTRIRRLMNPSFLPVAVERLEPAITQAVDGLLDRIELHDGEFDAMSDFAKYLMRITLLDVMLGLDEDAQRVFGDLERAIWQITYTPPGVEYPREAIEAFDNGRRLIERLIRERRAQPGDDLISRLIQARDEGDKLSDKELFDQVFTVCVAALNSTAGSMGGALLTLLRNPDQLDELRRDPSLVEPAIEECLRYHAPGLMTFPRIALVETDIGGTKIFPGMVVRAAFGAANFDPEQFPDPERFDIHRNPKNTMAFGAGPHHCLGHRLARTVLRISLIRFNERFPEARLKDPNFVPTYEGAAGETLLVSLPVLVS